MPAENGKQILDNNILEIHTFGEFSIRRGELQFSESAGRAKKVLTLIEYLVANRCLVVSLEKLFEAVWDEEEFDNPLNTLKNLVYRARNLLKCLNGEGYEPMEFILHEGNTYIWNPNLTCVVDAEELDREFKESQHPEISKDERMQHYYAIQNLYAGEFLPKSSYYEWVIHMDAYYQSIYNKSSKELILLLQEKEQYTEVVNICERFILRNAFDESVHCTLLQAYAKTGQMKQLLSHYQIMTDQFFKEYGIQLSGKTRKLYKELTKSIHNVELDIYNIQEDLQEEMHKKGAFICDYDIFKSIYRLNARSMMRNGAPIYFALFTIMDDKGDIIAGDTIKRAMPAMREALSETLRMGDVVTSYSSVQWLVQLPYASYENGWKVCERVKESFFRKVGTKRLKLDISMNEILPIME